MKSEWSKARHSIIKAIYLGDEMTIEKAAEIARNLSQIGQLHVDAIQKVADIILELAKECEDHNEALACEYGSSGEMFRLRKEWEKKNCKIDGYLEGKTEGKDDPD